MQCFFDLRFNRGWTQRQVACEYRIGQPAVSRRERRIRDRFVRAGLPEPVPAGRQLFSVSVSSL
jgi:transcriptional regulator with XRE-family HTH domain